MDALSSGAGGLATRSTLTRIDRDWRTQRRLSSTVGLFIYTRRRDRARRDTGEGVTGGDGDGDGHARRRQTDGGRHPGGGSEARRRDVTSLRTGSRAHAHHGASEVHHVGRPAPAAREG